MTRIQILMKRFESGILQNHRNLRWNHRQLLLVFRWILFSAYHRIFWILLINASVRFSEFSRHSSSMLMSSVETAVVWCPVLFADYRMTLCCQEAGTQTTQAPVRLFLMSVSFNRSFVHSLFCQSFFAFQRKGWPQICQSPRCQPLRQTSFWRNDVIVRSMISCQSNWTHWRL